MTKCKRYNPIWNIFDAEDRNSKSRSGSPTSLAKHDRGLSTIIGKINRDASGQQIDSAMKNRIGRWRTWDFKKPGTSNGKKLSCCFLLNWIY